MRPETTPRHEAALAAYFGPVARAVGERYFDPIPFPEDRLADLSRRGEVVHVMRTAGILNVFFLLWALLRHGLPALRTVVGLNHFGWIRLGRLLQEGPLSERLERVYAEGRTALLFLRERSAVLPRLSPPVDPLHAFVERARRSERPIYLVPELFLWGPQARNIVPSLRDLLFGDPETPGILRTAWGFLLHRKSTSFVVGEPLDLSAFVRERAGLPDGQLLRAIRGALRQQMGRAARPFVGPTRRPAARTIEHTLRNPALNAALAEVAAETGRSVHEVRKESYKLLKQLAARQSPLLIEACKPPLNWLFTKLHAGVVVDETGLARANAAAKNAPILWCPTHKSHLDYLLMAWVFWLRGILPPLVAAGVNLSFWPLGPFFAGGGAYFVRRSFKGDQVYTATFRAYVRQLLREGWSQEFFIEGGRSRTGLILSPRLGLLSFQVEAFLDGAQEDVILVPAAIDYENVVEHKSYAQEAAGGEKRPESIRSLLAAPKALTHRHGRIYVSFAEPISLKAFLTARAPDLARLTDDQRRQAIQDLGQKIRHGMSRAVTITPTALIAAAFLADHTEPTAIPVASRRIEYLRHIARAEGIKLSPLLDGRTSDPTAPGPLNVILRQRLDDGSIRAFVRGETTAYAVPPEKRIALAYYKNTLVNLVAGRSLVATALSALRGKAGRAALFAAFRALRESLELEIALPLEITAEEEFSRVIAALAAEGAIVETASGIEAARTTRGRERLALLESIVRDTVETYRWVGEELRDVPLPASRKDLTKALFDRCCSRVGERGQAPRALSKPTLENALAYAISRGALIADADGRLSHGPSTDAFQALAARA